MALGTITLKDLRNDLRSRLSDHGLDGQYLDEELNTWLNDAMLRVGTILYKVVPELYMSQNKQTLSDSDTYTVTDAKEIRSVYISDDFVPLLSPELFTLRQSISLYDSTLFATVMNNVVLLNKKIDGEVTTYYIRKVRQMSSDTDVIDVPDAYVDLLLLYAMSIVPQRNVEINFRQLIDKELASLFTEEQVKEVINDSK